MFFHTQGYNDTRGNFCSFLICVQMNANAFIKCLELSKMFYMDLPLQSTLTYEAF